MTAGWCVRAPGPGIGMVVVHVRTSQTPSPNRMKERLPVVSAALPVPCHKPLVAGGYNILSVSVY